LYESRRELEQSGLLDGSAVTYGRTTSATSDSGRELQSGSSRTKSIMHWLCT